MGSFPPSLGHTIHGQQLISNCFPVFIFNQHTAQTPRKHLEIHVHGLIRTKITHGPHPELSTRESRSCTGGASRGLPRVRGPCSDYDYTSDFDIEAASCERSDILLRIETDNQCYDAHKEERSARVNTETQ